MRLWLLVVVLTFSAFIRTEDITIFQECQTVVGEDACTSAVLQDCSVLEVTLTYGSTVNYTTSVDFNSLIGGATTLYCADIPTPPCSLCWQAYNVSITNGELQSCYGFSVACGGFIPFHQQIDLGCETVPVPECTAPCTNDCSGHGQCVGGSCQCDPGYQGDSCNIAVGGGCLSLLDSPDVDFCVSPNLSGCSRLVYHITGPTLTTAPNWIVNIGGPARESQTDHYTITGLPSCETYLRLVNFTVYQTGLVAGTVAASLSCLNNQTFFISYSELQLGPACSPICSFSTNDPGLIPEPKDVELDEGEVKYYFVEQLVGEPIADAKLQVSMSRGSMAMYESRSCRPTEDQYDSHDTAPAGVEDYTWNIIDDCNGALQATFSSTAYYFMFECISSGGCQFSLTLVRHTIISLTMNLPSPNRPIFNVPNEQYQYFEVVVPRDDFVLRLQVHHPVDIGVSAAMYVQPQECPTVESFLTHSSQSTSIVLHNQQVDNYEITLFPGLLGLDTGAILAIAVVFAPIENAAGPPGFFTIAAYYLEDEYTSGSISEPDITETVIYSDSVPVSDPSNPVDTDSVIVVSSTSTTVEPQSSYSNSVPDKSTPDDGDGGDDGDETGSSHLFLFFLLGGVVLLVLILVPVVGYVLYKIKRSRRSKFPLSIDDDGLLLSNDDEADFEL